MNQVMRVVGATFAVMFVMCAPAMAQDAAAAHALISFKSAGALSAGLVIIGGAMAIGKIGVAAVESMARQPEIAANIQTGMQCTGVAQDEATVTAIFENGELHRGDLVVAADGFQSAIRKQLVGADEPRYSGYTCYRSVVSMVHRTLPPGLALTAIGHGTEFGLFPCGMGRIYWFATHNQPAQKTDSPRGRKADCLTTFAGFPEPFVHALHQTPEADILRHDVYDRAPLLHFGDGRVTLLGDACHPMTPNLGQGACMAIEDAVVLARCLRDEPNEVKALRHYETARRERTTLMTTRSYYAGKVLTLEDGVLSWFRNRLLHSKLGGTQAESELEKLLSYQVPTL